MNRRSRSCPLFHPLLVAALFAAAASAAAEPPAYIMPTPAETAARLRSRDWWTLLAEEVPPLRHELGTRWPLVLWHGPGTQPLSPAQLRLLQERGLAQPIPMDTSMIRTAQVLQAAGAKVIMLDGRSGNWPYSLAGDSTRWALQFEAGYTYEMAGRGALGSWHSAMPLLTEGWAVLADQIRATLRAFRAAGVTVDGLWMDWETDPYPFPPLFEQLRHCRLCRGMLPAEVLADRAAWFAYCWRAYTRLYDAYLAAPALEIFPRCAVTNWHVVFSSPQHPAYYFVDDRVIPPVAPGSITASNPVAYGSDLWFQRAWRDEYPRDRRHVDQFYVHNLLRLVSADAANRRAFAPQVRSFPWVARWCNIEAAAGDSIPDISRTAWREVLRHLWLRDIDGMQVFNPRHPDYEQLWLEELQDAVAVYDEMLAYGEFLDDGEAMNLDYPPPQDDGVFWSGLRLDERAVVRVTNQGDQPAWAIVPAWPQASIRLEVPPEAGRTWRLERRPDGVHAELQAAGAPVPD